MGHATRSVVRDELDRCVGEAGGNATHHCINKALVAGVVGTNELVMEFDSSLPTFHAGNDGGVGLCDNGGHGICKGERGAAYRGGGWLGGQELGKLRCIVDWERGGHGGDSIGDP